MSRVCLDGKDLGCGATGAWGAAGVQDEETGALLLWTPTCCLWAQHSPVNVSGPVEGGVTVEWCSGGAGRARVA